MKFFHRRADDYLIGFLKSTALTETEETDNERHFSSNIIYHVLNQNLQ